MKSFLAVLRVLGHPVGRRAGALLVAIGLPGAILFGPQGMGARDLVAGMADSPGLRAFVWLGWLLLSAHAMAALEGAPGSLVLRSLRPRRGPTVAALAVLALGVQVPWLALHARGGGQVAAVGAVAIAIAVGTRRLLALPLLVLVLAGMSTAWLAPVAVVVAVVALDRGWRHPRAEREPHRADPVRRRAPLVALVRMHLLRVARLAPARLGIAAILVAIAGAGLLTLRSDPTPAPLRRVLAILALPGVLGAALLVEPVLASERAALGLLRSLRISRATAVGAFLVAVITPTTALAATASAAATVACRLPWSLAPAAIVWTAALGAITGGWGRRFDPGAKRSLFALGVVVLAIVASITVLP